MTEIYCSDQMNTISATFFYDNNPENPTIIKKEISTYIIVDTISEFIKSQYTYIYGENPPQMVLNDLINGFMLFNLHKNKYMLKSKNEFLKYIKANTISIEEKLFFIDIVLYNQKPDFLTCEEREYIRACGHLDGFH